MRPIRVRLPVHLLAAAAVATAGFAAYQGVDRLVLAKNSGVSLGTTDDGTGGVAPTSTTVSPEPEPTTSTTAVPAPPPTTSTTKAKEYPPTTKAKPKEYAPKTTPTTKRKEYPPASTKPKPVEPTYAPKPSSGQLSLYCMSVPMPDGVPTIKCKWSLTKAPNFHHYRLTREAHGQPRQAVFETLKWDTDRHYDQTVQPGNKYSYVLEVYDANGILIESAGPIYAGCCEEAAPKP
jgi:hypothetical protein